MGIERIKELNALANQMEEMKKNAIAEITDRKELRFLAIEKIQEYLRDVAEATSGFNFYVDIHTRVYYYDDNWYLKFENGKVYLEFGVFKEKDFISLEREDFYRYDNNGTFYWQEGIVKLIENWQEIKREIESETEKKIIEKMNKTQKELVDFKTSYEKVVNFEA